MKRWIETTVDWIACGLAAAGLSMFLYSSIGLYKTSRKIEKSLAELKIDLERLKNPTGERCDYVSDLPTRRELVDCLKYGKDAARLDGISLRSWKAVIEPGLAKVPEGDNIIERQNRENVYCSVQASLRDAQISCNSLLKDLDESHELLDESRKNLQNTQKTLQNGAEDFKKTLGEFYVKPDDCLRKLERALEAYIKYKIVPLHDKFEASLRDKASESEKDELMFEVFELSSPLSQGYYPPRRFYRELVQLLGNASGIKNPDRKKATVRRLVNIALGYARHHLPPSEYMLPILFEFSELGYAPEELDEMVVFK